MIKSFWATLVGAGPSGPRKFTLDELKELYEVLRSNPVVTESNVSATGWAYSREAP